jgi:hypothetical protein
MLHFILGTDREKVRTVLAEAMSTAQRAGFRVARITDVSSLYDLHASMQGRGLFEEKKLVIFDGVWGVAELKEAICSSLTQFKASSDIFYLIEEKLEAAERKVIEKYAAVKKEKETFNIFSLANALKTGNKKDLWVGYHRALISNAPEAIHGILFWGAKDLVLKARTAPERVRALRFVAALAELPHKARREGMGLSYALEHFVLSKI